MRANIKTFGCTLNQADSDIIASLLLDSGSQIVEDKESADITIFNTCTVKGATAQKILYKLSQMEKRKERVLVTGCMAGANRDLIEKYAPSASIVTTQNIPAIVEYARNTANGSRQIAIKKNPEERLESLTHFGGVISKVPVSDGCLSSCSFCETKFARGPLKSFREETILKAIEQSVKHGAKEIQLTSQDMGAYGVDKKTNLSELMAKIIAIPGDFKVRIGMLNPEHLNKQIEGIAAALNSGRFYKFIHIPIESGSDSVLQRMQRHYTVAQITAQLDYLRGAVIGIGIETDIIVGFPGETDREFNESLETIRRLKFEVVNISKFAARPHAPASKMKQLTKELVKERSTEMTRVVRETQRKINERYIGKEVEVIFTEAAKKSVNGRTESYRQVVATGNTKPQMGGREKVLVDKVSANAIYGKLVK